MIRSAGHFVARCMYDPDGANDSGITIRRAAYGEFALQQEGGKRSVYLTRAALVRLAFRLIREATSRHHTT